MLVELFIHEFFSPSITSVLSKYNALLCFPGKFSEDYIDSDLDPLPCQSLL